MKKDNKIPEMIGQYELCEQLGEGAFGQVWRAYDAKNGRDVAIKLLNSNSSEDFLKRFQREVKIAARLKSPYTVTLHDSGEHEGRYYLVLEHLEGCTLSDQVRRDGKLAPLRVAKILEQTLISLAEAHELGCIHRDIKPENIFNVGPRQGMLDFAKVLDFGIAKVIRDDSALLASRDGNTPGEGQGDDAPHHDIKHVTMGNDLFGTLLYMAPEMFDLKPDFHARMDIYSLGMTAWYMLEGSLPYQSFGSSQLITHHMTDSAPSLELPQGEAQGVRDIINKMLAKRPLDRYQSCMEVLADVQKLERRQITGPLERAEREARRAQLQSESHPAQIHAVAPDFSQAPVAPPAPSKLFIEAPTERHESPKLFVEPQPTQAVPEAKLDALRKADERELPKQQDAAEDAAVEGDKTKAARAHETTAPLAVEEGKLGRDGDGAHGGAKPRRRGLMVGALAVLVGGATALAFTMSTPPTRVDEPQGLAPSAPLRSSLDALDAVQPAPSAPEQTTAVAYGLAQREASVSLGAALRSGVEKATDASEVPAPRTSAPPTRQIVKQPVLKTPASVSASNKPKPAPAPAPKPKSEPKPKQPKNFNRFVLD